MPRSTKTRARRGRTLRTTRSAPGTRAAQVGAAAALALLWGAAPALARTTPSLLTNASSNTTVGLQVFDHANLSGASPTGTLSFRLYRPGDTTCQSPVFTSNVAVSGTGSDDSTRYTTPAGGVYQWVASYSGDANNNPVATQCGDPRQSVEVGRTTPAVSLATAFTNGALHATATIAYGFAPVTGTITFTVTGPNDQFCQAAAAHTSTVPINGDGTYDSGPFTPTTPGTYTYRIRYNGDTNNYGVGPTSCLDQTASVTVTQNQLGTPPPTSTVPPATTKPPANPLAPTARVPGAGSTTSPTSPAQLSTALVLVGPSRCVRGPFKVWVTGAQVRRVTYYLHGRRLRTVTRVDSAGRFATRINPRGLPRRTGERLLARVASSGGARVLHRTFTVCG